MVLNRRKFFKWLGVGTAVAAVAPSVLTSMEPAVTGNVLVAQAIHGMQLSCSCASDSFWDGPCEYCQRQPKVTSYNEYVDYANFSSFAIANSIDEAVNDVAIELAYRQKVLLNELVSHVGV